MKRILIAVDFTEKGMKAIEMAKTLNENKEIELHAVNIVKNKDDVSKIKEEFNKLDLGFETHVRVGSIYKDISDFATEIEADLVLMGVNPSKSFFTSPAMKVIRNSEIPFITLQEETEVKGIDNILLPLDLSNETKQKLEMATNIAKIFNSRIILFIPNEKDEFFVKKLNRNLAFVSNFLKAKNVNFKTIISDSNGKYFVKDIIDFSEKVDLISIINLQENSLFGVLGDSYEQKIISNKNRKPVLILNPKTNTVSNSVFSG